MAGVRCHILVSVLLAFCTVALEAGGWVVITVTELPDSISTNQPLTITYAVRQHGMRLLGGLDGRVEARTPRGPVVSVSAVPAREPGYYVATLTLPRADDWTVDIISGFGGQLDRSRVELSVLDDTRAARVLSAVERGQRLYVSKGCITCHAHGAVRGRSTSAGPTLTRKLYEPDRLRRVLTAPSREERFEPPNWQMPDLGLRDVEIEALMAFLNAAGSERR